MNVRVKVGGEITLPPDVVAELDLVPGSEVSFERAPNGSVVLAKVAAAQGEQPRPTMEEIRQRLEKAATDAREHLLPEVAGMTGDQYMNYIRGE